MIFKAPPQFGVVFDVDVDLSGANAVLESLSDWHRKLIEIGRAPLGIHSFRNLVVIGGILWIAFVVEATQFIEYSRNVLLTNGQWVSSKLLLQMYVMGSEQFMTTRNALFRDQLHLGEWHGFNELSLKEPVEPAAIEYRFRLSRGAYLYFIFNRSASGHYGIRLSRNAKFPSMFYQADRLNKFVSRTALDLTPSRLNDGWHNLVLSFGSGEVIANLDGAALSSMPVNSEGPQIIGLRGGFLPADRTLSASREKMAARFSTIHLATVATTGPSSRQWRSSVSW
jgi:hypothetical protein